MPRKGLRLRRLASADDPGLPGLLALYAEAIPASERKPPGQIACMVGRGDYVVLLAEEGGSPVGFSIYCLPPGRDFFLLEYMAVAASFRSRGLGGRMFAAGLEEVRGGTGRGACLVEVDSPREGSPDQALRARRQGFYRRHGCRRAAGLDYRLPLPGDPPRMDLMVHLPQPGPGPVRVDRATVRAWLVSLYVDVYGCPGNDARIGAMMRNLGDSVSLD